MDTPNTPMTPSEYGAWMNAQRKRKVGGFRVPGGASKAAKAKWAKWRAQKAEGQQ